MTLPPFAVTRIAKTTILTPLVENLSVTNASWLKAQILDYYNQHQPESLWLNLSNIQHLDRLGLGALLSLNTTLKALLPFGLMGVNSNLETQLQRWSYGFDIWRPPAACPVCKQSECRHTDELLRLALVCDLNHWLNQPLPPPETPVQKWVRVLTGQLAAAIPKVALPPGTATLWEPEEETAWPGLWRHYLQIGFSSMCFVGFAAGLVWLTLEWDAHSDKKWNRPSIGMKKTPLSQAELLERFDRNGDGVFNQQDWWLLSSHEKLILINHGFSERHMPHDP